MADDEQHADEQHADEQQVDEPIEEHAPPPDPVVVALLERLDAQLGDAILERADMFGTPVVRVRADAWRRAAEVAKTELACDYLSFVSAIDWQPAPREGSAAGADTSSPVQPSEMTFGLAGSAGRFQVLAHVQSTTRRWGITMKTDVDESDARAQSWVPVYPGADWHERECWEMFGFAFDGHPALRNLYLPSGFEGHPLRKDFPLLAREVKPWPGLVDVEALPGDAPGDGSGDGDAAADGEA